MSQAKRHPFSIHSSIFSFKFFNLSDLDLNSTIKSGHIGANSCRFERGIAFHFSMGINEVSGDRIAPLGRVKPAEELKTFHSLYFLFQIPTSVVILASLSPLSLKVGDIIINLPSRLRSICNSLFLAHNSRS